MPFTAHSDPTTIADCIRMSWALRVNCGACTRWVKWGQQELSRLPPGATVDSVASRMRCDVCGSRDGVVHRVQDHVPRAPE